MFLSDYKPDANHVTGTGRYGIIHFPHRELEEYRGRFPVLGAVGAVQHGHHGVVHQLRAPDLDSSLQRQGIARCCL